MNGPKNFHGRKVGALITDGVDQGILDALRQALEAEGAMLEIVAPTVGGVKSSSGGWVAANQKIGGGPSVLYDAVAILPAANQAEMLAKNPAAREFAADAFTHLKFIAYTDGAKPLLEKAGIAKDLDKGCIPVFQICCSCGLYKPLPLTAILGTGDGDQGVSHPYGISKIFPPSEPFSASLCASPASLSLIFLTIGILSFPSRTASAICRSKDASGFAMNASTRRFFPSASFGGPKTDPSTPPDFNLGISLPMTS